MRLRLRRSPILSARCVRKSLIIRLLRKARLGLGDIASGFSLSDRKRVFKLPDRYLVGFCGRLLSGCLSIDYNPGSHCRICIFDLSVTLACPECLTASQFPERPQWLIWTVWSYNIYGECVRSEI